MFVLASVSGIGVTFVGDTAGTDRSRGREEIGVKRLSWTLVVGGASMISMGTRRVRGFGRDNVGRAGMDRFECSSASASTF